MLAEMDSKCLAQISHLLFPHRLPQALPRNFLAGSSGKKWVSNGPVGGKPLPQVKVARCDYWKMAQNQGMGGNGACKTSSLNCSPHEGPELQSAPHWFNEKLRSPRRA